MPKLLAILLAGLITFGADAIVIVIVCTIFLILRDLIAKLLSA